MDQASKLQLGRRVLAAGIIWLVTVFGGAIALGFLYRGQLGPGLGTFSSVVFIIGVLVGLACVLLGLVWGFPPATGEKAVSNVRRGSWIYWLLLSAFGVYQATQDWFRYDEDPLRPFESWAAPLVLFALLMILTRRFNLRQWLSADADLRPRDERESAIISGASRIGFTLTIFVTFAAMLVFYYAPLPSKSAIFDVMITAVMLQFAIRNFIAWRMGLR